MSVSAANILNHERYETKFLLGEGAFGSVYHGWDRQLERDVAIKVPKVGAKFRPDNFLQEAKSAARLRHPGLVAVYDAGVDRAGRLFTVYELIDGHPLSELSAAGKVDVVTAVRLVAEAAEAMAYTHGKDFVHRDLKPSNILVDGDGRARVTDFGLALDENQLRDRAGEVSGSPAYMSPEQVRGEANRLDGRTDIWSLGVILYELLTGRRPFYGRHQPEYFDEILNREPKPMRQLNAAIPRPLDDIVLKCLAKSVRERHATAGDLAADLRAWLSESSHQMPSDSHQLRLPRTSPATAPTVATMDPQVTTARDSKRLAGSRVNLQRRFFSWWMFLAAIMTAVVGVCIWTFWIPPGGNSSTLESPAEPPGGENGEPTANSALTQTSRQQIKRREANPDGWRTLLTKSPETLLSPPGVRSFVSFFDPHEQELHATSNQFFMLNLGQIDTEDFDFTINLTQTPWIGGIGVYFGSNLENLVETTVDIRPAHVCQAIEIVRSGDQLGRIELGRSMLTLIGQRQLKMRETLALAPVALRSGMDTELIFEVERGLVTKIQFDGQQFPTLVGEDIDQELRRRKVIASGKVGVILSDGSGVFRTAAWRFNRGE